MLLEMGNKGKREYGIRFTRRDIYNVYVRWWSPLPLVLCIGGMTINSGFEQILRFVDSF